MIWGLESIIAVAFALVLSWAKDSNTGVIYPAQEKENSMNCIRTDEEIARVEHWAEVADGEGWTSYPGRTYEQGVLDTICWLRGDSEDAPDE